jgi:hypothetical protein
MITNDGKELLSKYLLGQAPAYATHISIGCGARPLQTDDEAPPGNELKEKLDFEMLRIPISSRGFVEEGGQTKISLIAELPTENRYEITELGIWSAANNSLARGFDSRMIFDFQGGWESHNTTISQIPLKTSLGVGSEIEDDGDIVFRANTSDPVIQNDARKQRKEGSRFLNTSIFMRGDSSVIEGNEGEWSAQEDEEFVSTHIHFNSVNLNIQRNAASDVFSLAFSLIDKQALTPTEPKYVKILMEFFTSEVAQETGFAKKEIYVDGSEFTNNSYKSIEFPISELITTPDFTSSRIRVARIFCSVIVDDNGDDVVSADHYIALDGFRLDNITTENPLYKMIGYSQIKNSNGFPATKFANSNNYVEFRFAVGVS